MSDIVVAVARGRQPDDQVGQDVRRDQCSGAGRGRVSIDGVLADVHHRLHHIARRPKDWPAFFAAAHATWIPQRALRPDQ